MKIAVLFGGNSSERDVSIASGIQITKALKEAGHNVLAVDTFRGVLSDVEVQVLLSRGIAPEPPSTHDLEVVKAKTFQAPPAKNGSGAAPKANGNGNGNGNVKKVPLFEDPDDDVSLEIEVGGFY